jgi:hypothetical protein
VRTTGRGAGRAARLCGGICVTVSKVNVVTAPQPERLSGLLSIP